MRTATKADLDKLYRVRWFKKPDVFNYRRKLCGSLEEHGCTAVDLSSVHIVFNGYLVINSKDHCPFK